MACHAEGEDLKSRTRSSRIPRHELSAFRAKLASDLSFASAQTKGPASPLFDSKDSDSVKASKYAPGSPNWYQSNLCGAGGRRYFSNQRL